MRILTNYYHSENFIQENLTTPFHTFAIKFIISRGA